MNNTLEIEKLAFQYFSGTISLDKEKQLLDFIEQSPSNLKQFREWEELWKEAAQNNDEINQVWETFKANKLPNSKSKVYQRRFQLVTRMAKIAALLLFAVLSTLFVQSLMTSSDQSTAVLVEAPYGEKSKITLADGSIVWLNSGSTLSCVNDNIADKQIVSLSGEGYFEITKNKDRKFVVRTKYYDIEVVGTKFNVTAYDDDRYVTTSLMEGEVNVVCDNSKTVLLPGQYISFDTNTGSLQKPNIVLQAPNNWIYNAIIYDDITLKELVVKLSRQYNVNIMIQSDELENKKINIALRNDESISDVMKAIEKILNVSIQNTGINYQINLK